MTLSAMTHVERVWHQMGDIAAEMLVYLHYSLIIEEMQNNIQILWNCGQRWELIKKRKFVTVLTSVFK